MYIITNDRYLSYDRGEAHSLETSGSTRSRRTVSNMACVVSLSCGMSIRCLSFARFRAESAA